jgi:tetratricopeptide (TPR) repeat protein
LLVISVVSLSTVGHQQQRSELAEAHVNRAKSLFAKGDLAGAIASYSDAIKVKPEWAEAYLKRGVALRMQGALDKAIEDFDKATALDPASTRNNRTIADAYGNHGQIQLSNLRPEDAIVDFEKALRIYPAGTRPYFDRGEAHILIEDFTRAIEDFDTYLTKEKWDAFNKALAQANRSLAKHFLGRDDEAKGDLKSIANLAPAEKKAVLQHMEELEVRLMIMRHIRSQRRKTIA